VTPAIFHRLGAAMRLAALCASTLGAAHAGGRTDPPLARDEPQAAPRPTPAAYHGERAPVKADTVRNLFERRSWLPPAPPPPPPAPVVVKAPEAPRLPFSYLGVIDGKAIARQVLLAKGDQLFIVKKSDVIEGQYRIDDITDKDVEMTYLPLQQRQSLATEHAAP
jgi:hypothetical protein